MGVVIKGLRTTGLRPVGPDGERVPSPIYLSIDDPDLVAWSSGNARIYFRAMGIDAGEHLIGDVSVEEAEDAIRRGLESVSQDITRRALGVIREREVQMARGSDYLRPKVISAELRTTDVVRALGQFSRAVRRFKQMGADRIGWE